MGLDDWVGVIVLVALALDYMRAKKLDDWIVQRHEDRLRDLGQGIHEQTRRVDTLFEGARGIEQRLADLEQRIDKLDTH